MSKEENRNLLGGWGAMYRPPQETKPIQRVEESLGTEEEPSLGELNPLIHHPELARKESVDALTKVTLEKIKKYGGVLPTKLESTLVCSIQNSSAPAQLRYIARFEVEHLSASQMDLLESLVKTLYPVKVRTRVNGEGKDIELGTYPPISLNDIGKSRTAGWYMGPDQSYPTDSLHAGLFVFKDFGEVNRGNFHDDSLPGKYIVEVREASMYQTDLVQFITQISVILGQEQLLPYGDSLYEIYYDLLRLGLKKVDDLSVYGLDSIVAQINRGLIWPLANLSLAREMGQQPESVVLIGVPGTGKTLALEQILQHDTGVLIVPIDPLELTKEMLKDKDKQTLLPRITDVSRRTGKKTILHVDDIEVLAGNDTTHSTLLNLLAGVRDSGFYVIASTNEPEKISDSLMQPQRFGVRIHCGLHPETVRYEILKIHAAAESARLGLPLFRSSEERERILSLLARNTDGYTPRYLAEILNVAKSFMLERIISEKGVVYGLNGGDLDGYYFILDDFKKAFAYVSTVFDKEGTKRRDKELRQFVNRSNRQPVGFSANGHGPSSIFDSH